MEMDELKNMWSMMDEKLKKQEILNKSLVKEILQTKGNKSLNRLFLYEILGFSVCLLLIPFILYCLKTYEVAYIIGKVTLYLTFAFCIVYCLWGILKMSELFKVDFSKDIANNIYHISKYDIRMKYEKTGMYIFIPVLFLLSIVLYIQSNIDIEQFIFMIVIFLLATSISIWSYKKTYPALISSIKDSLDKINELKED